MIDVLAELLMSGVLLGGLYAMVALGFALIYGVLRILNLTHGDYLMLGALASYLLVTNAGMDPLWTLPVIASLFFLVGVSVERALIKRIFYKPTAEIGAASLMVTLGLSFFICDLVFRTIKSSDFGVPWYMPPITLGGVAISSLRLIVLLLILAFGVGLTFFLKKTFTGMAVRAVMQDREATMIMGVNISALSTVVFGICIMLAALAGWALVFITNLHPFIGMYYTIRASIIVIIGGMGSILGAILGGFILGIAETFIGYHFGISWSPCIGLLILLLILVIRPRGLFGHE